MIEQDLLEGNKYFKWYWSICNRAKDRILSPDIYVEKHHIYPKSIYGQNKDLVKLTAKEHYMVHLLLWWGLRTKFGTKDKNTIKMANAFKMMNVQSQHHDIQRYSSKKYLFLKQAYIESMKGNQNGKANKGRITSKETREKLSNSGKGNQNGKANKGRITSKETRKNLSLSKIGKNNPMFNRPISDETRNKHKEISKDENNPCATKYIIQNSSCETFELINEKNVVKYLGYNRGFLYNKQEYKGYILIKKIRINSRINTNE